MNRLNQHNVVSKVCAITAFASMILLFQNCAPEQLTAKAGQEVMSSASEEFESNPLGSDLGDLNTPDESAPTTSTNPVPPIATSAATPVDCRTATPPSTFTLAAFSVLANERPKTTQVVAVDSNQDGGRIDDPTPLSAADRNYRICDDLAAGINDRPSPTVVENVTSAADLMARLPSSCAPNTVNQNCPAGRLITLPVGTFEISDAITLCKDCVLRGSGIGKTIIKAGKLNQNVLRISSGSRVENVTIEGAWNTEDDSYIVPERLGSGVLISNIRNFAFINVGIKRHSGQGIAAWNARYGCFWGMELERNGHRGINISTYSHDLKLYRITGKSAHYAHVLFGHGAHSISLRDSTFTDMYATQFEKAQGKKVGHVMLWLANDVHDVDVKNVTFKQITSDSAVEPKGILIGNSRNNQFDSLQFDGLTYGIYMTSGRIGLSVPGLTNSDTAENTFNNIAIKANASISKPGSAIVLLTSRKYLVRSTCSLRHLVAGQEGLVSRIRDNRYSKLTISGYPYGVVTSPTSFAPTTIASTAVKIIDGSPAPSRITQLANESIADSSGW